MDNENNKIEETEVTETEVTETEVSKSESEKAEATNIESEKAEVSEANDSESKSTSESKPESKQAELDESDDDLEPVDLNASDYNSKSDKYSEGISLNGRKKLDDKSESAEHRPVRKREKKQVDQYKQKRIRKRIRVFVILAILIGAGLFVYFKVLKPRADAAKAMMNQVKEQTDTIEKRDITDAITTTGTFEASEARTLTSTAKDTTIDAVMAKVGDTVKEGDTMVLFSTENINKTIEQLQEDLSKQKQKDAIDSQANDRTYLFTYANQSTELASAADKVDTTLKALYEACDGYGKAKRELQQKKDEGLSDDQLVAYQNAVNQAYQQEQTAQTNYDAAVNAQAQLIARTGNTLTEADENRQKNAISSGDQATNISRQIEEYQDKLENYVITAPISGTVTSVSVEEGNGFSGGTVMVIQNTDTFKIKALIDEYDINNIKLGQRVVIKTNATGDDELLGYVSFIAPTSTSTTTVTTTASVSASGNGMTSSVSSSSGSSANYEITINVITKDERIKIGMSAKLNIVVDQVSGVLTVPYDAISTNAKGENYITVIDNKKGFGDMNSAKNDSSKDSSMPVLTVNGENVSSNADMPSGGPGGDFPSGGPSGDFPGGGDSDKGSRPDGAASMNNNTNRREIIVTVGMEGDYYTQIISDEIEEGMTVVIPQSNESGGFGFGGMGMGMGGPGGF